MEESLKGFKQEKWEDQICILLCKEWFGWEDISKIRQTCASQRIKCKWREDRFKRYLKTRFRSIWWPVRSVLWRWKAVSQMTPNLPVCANGWIMGQLTMSKGKGRSWILSMTSRCLRNLKHTHRLLHLRVWNSQAISGKKVKVWDPFI